MKIQDVNRVNFGGLNNPTLLKTLKYIGDNNAMISSGVALAAGGIIRPLVTLSAPSAPKDNKEYIATKSISSAFVGFGLTGMFFNPISKSLKKIGENPQNYLKEETIKRLKGNAKNLKDSQAYSFLEQSIKMSSEALAVIPKAVLTCALITPLVKGLFDKKKENEHNNMSFKGLSDKAISKVFDSKTVQNFAIKNQNSNINQFLMNAKDIIATLCFIVAAKTSKTIDEKEKSPLMINSMLSTGLTIGLGAGVKKLIDKPMERFIDTFKKSNPDISNINKYVNGIKVLEPIVILSSVYYIATPFISTFLTGKLTNKGNVSENK